MKWFAFFPLETSLFRFEIVLGPFHTSWIWVHKTLLERVRSLVFPDLYLVLSYFWLNRFKFSGRIRVWKISKFDPSSLKQFEIIYQPISIWVWSSTSGLWNKIISNGIFMLLAVVFPLNRFWNIIWQFFHGVFCFIFACRKFLTIDLEHWQLFFRKSSRLTMFLFS